MDEQKQTDAFPIPSINPADYGQPAGFERPPSPTPEDLQHEREQAETFLASTIDATFDKNTDFVTTDPDGTNHLRLFMPWAGGGNRGAVVATLDLIRRPAGENANATSMSFSAKRAWDSHAIFDHEGVHDAWPDETGTIQARDDYLDGYFRQDSSRTALAQTWARNLENGLPEKPHAGRQILGRVLGKRALKAK